MEVTVGHSWLSLATTMTGVADPYKIAMTSCKVVISDGHMSHLWGGMPGKLQVLHTHHLLLAVTKRQTNVTQGREGLF